MKPEVELLVGLVARYERWKAGELSPDVMPGHRAGAKKDRIRSTALVAYDPSNNMPRNEVVMMRVYTYARYSTDRQKKDLIRSQLSLHLAHCCLHDSILENFIRIQLVGSARSGVDAIRNILLP